MKKFNRVLSLCMLILLLIALCSTPIYAAIRGTSQNGKLTITTSIAGDTPATPATFSFTVEGQKGKIFSIVGAGSITISGIPAGVYTVTEIKMPVNYSIGDYDQDVIIAGGQTTTVNFRNKYTAPTGTTTGTTTDTTTSTPTGTTTGTTTDTTTSTPTGTTTGTTTDTTTSTPTGTTTGTTTDTTTSTTTGTTTPVVDSASVQVTVPANAVSLIAPGNGLTPAKGNGTDETSVIQSIIYYAVKNHLPLLIPEGYTFTVDRLTIGAVSNFSIYGLGTLKHKAGATGPILKISNCSDFSIPVWHTDGNVSQNYGTAGPYNQNLHSLSINSSQNFSIGSLYDVNPSGDSLYLNGVTNGTIGTIQAKADLAGTGRNALCIIKAYNLVIDKVIAEKIGCSTQPGGIALEPNYSGDNIQYVTIKDAIVSCDADNGIEISNKFGAIVKDIEINATITKLNNPNSHAFKLNNVENFKGNVKVYQEGTRPCVGASITGCKNVTANIEIYNATLGIGIGQGSSGIHLTGKINGTQQAGIAIWEGLSDSAINMDIKRTGLNGSDGRVKVGGTVSNVLFKGDYSADGTGRYCFYLSGTLTGCRTENLITTGWTSSNVKTGSSASALTMS